MKRLFYLTPIAVALLLISCIQPVGDITPSDFAVQAYVDGTQVKLTWEDPADEVDGYILKFKVGGQYVLTDTIAPTINSYIHNPDGNVGIYELYGYKGDTVSDPVTVSIIPVTSSNITVYEFNNSAGNSGFGFNDQFTCVSYAVGGTNPQENIDFYYTNWAPGYADGDTYLASADQIANDPGRISAPTTGWRVNKIKKVSPSNGVIDTEPDLEKDFAITNAWYSFKVTRSSGWHYGVLQLGDATLAQTSLVTVKIQTVPGLKVIGR